MRMRRSTGIAIVVAVGAASAVVAAWTALWVAPAALRIGPDVAYAALPDLYRATTATFAAVWVVWSACVVAMLVVRMRWSDAWERRGRHRWISLAGCTLLAFGGVATGVMLPYSQVDLGLARVVDPAIWDPAPFELFRALWLAGWLAIAAAIVLGAVGALADRAIGRARRLA